MLANIVLILFVLSLILCIFLGIDVVFALSFGAVLFFLYCLNQKMSKKEAFNTMMDGVVKTFNVMSIFFIIGILTASWRMSGTIAYMIYELVPFINPNYFILASFLLCSLMSMMIGTSFGTVASMGVICMAIARSMGINELFVGGAIISGIYLGDRTSPMSSSASLVCSLTNTDLYKNIKNMLKTATVPFIMSCILYVLIGFGNKTADMDTSILLIFSEEYNLNFFMILPAAAILILSLMKINVKIVMAVSIAIASILSIIYQQESLADILKTYIFGYKAQNEELAKLMNGGGFISMLKPGITVIISSTYFGVFEKTPILKPIKSFVEKLAKKITVFGSMLLTSIFTGCITCNQSLTVMLTSQLTSNLQKDKYSHAVNLENSSILIPAMIPWNIAIAIPLSTIGVSSKAILYSFFTIILPLYIFIKGFMKKEKINTVI